ncbi:MAG TPA: hypothetical protein EYP22_06525 [Methanosarcinales archaeon]|nr:hypothetical protein [Methanosarcinales archaeon]
MQAKVLDYGETYHLVIPKTELSLTPDSEVHIKVETEEEMQIREKEELGLLVSYGLKIGAFQDCAVLLKLYYNGAINTPKKIDFNDAEISKLEELAKHPTMPVLKTQEMYYLTDVGMDLVEGLIIALKHLECELHRTN